MWEEVLGMKVRPEDFTLKAIELCTKKIFKVKGRESQEKKSK